MSLSDDDLAFVPEKFSGQARLFPLPNLVLFPHVVQPLHVYERRYVDLFQDAIEDDRLIAMALLRPGWESDYEGRPPIEPVACLGRVLTWQAQEGSRYNLLLLGLRRVRIVRELPAERTFRSANVEIIDDCYPNIGGGGRPVLQRKLVRAFRDMLPSIKDSADLFNQLSVKNMSLGTLTDVIAYALDMELDDKQRLLSTSDVDERARRVLAHLNASARQPCVAAADGGFPPLFSAN